MSINSVDPPTVSSNEQEITIIASISGLPNPSFFRVAWQKASGDTYFGYTKNNSGDWVKVATDQDCKNYYSVSDTATTSLFLLAKIGDDNNPENGGYTVKLRRYTATCGSNSDSAPYQVEIRLPTPIPSPTPTPVPTPVPTPPPTPSPTPVPQAKPTPSPTKKLSPVPTPTPEILGAESEPVESIEPAPSPVETPVPEENFVSRPPIIAGVFIGLGIVLTCLAALLAFKKQKENSPDILNE